MKPITTVLASIVVAAAVVIGLVFGVHFLWTGSWALARANANQAAHLARTQYGYQQTLREQITANLATVSAIDVQIAEDHAATAQLRAQKAAVVQMICQQSTQVAGDPLPANQSQFINLNCNGVVQ